MSYFVTCQLFFRYFTKGRWSVTGLVNRSGDTDDEAEDLEFDGSLFGSGSSNSSDSGGHGSNSRNNKAKAKISSTRPSNAKSVIDDDDIGGLEHKVNGNRTSSKGSQQKSNTETVRSKALAILLDSDSDDGSLFD